MNSFLPAAVADTTSTIGTPTLWALTIGGVLQGLAMLDALDNAKPWTPPTRTAKKEEVRDGPAGDGLPEWCEEGDVPQSKRTAYGIRAGKLCALTLKKDQDSGEEWVNVEDLASFTARIVAEVIEEDGSGDPRRVFRIEGHRPDGVPMFPPMIEVPTAEFSGMGWAVAKWGGAARLPAGQGTRPCHDMDPHNLCQTANVYMDHNIGAAVSGMEAV